MPAEFEKPVIAEGTDVVISIDRTPWNLPTPPSDTQELFPGDVLPPCEMVLDDGELPHLPEYLPEGLPDEQKPQEKPAGSHVLITTVSDLYRL